MQSLSAALLGVYLLGATPFLAPFSPRSSSSTAARSSASSRSSAQSASSTASSRRALPVLSAPIRINRSSSAASRTAIPALVPARSSVAPSAPTPTLTIGKARVDVLMLVNTERALVGLPPLKQNILLEKAAQAHSKDMREKRYISHTSLDGREPGTRIQATGYLTVNCTSCNYSTSTGENIGYGQLTAERIVAEWMKSPLHRANILDQQFRDAGVGFDGGYWTMTFGSVKIR